jgi:hypothetical protein
MLAFVVAVLGLWSIEPVRSTVCRSWLGGANVSLCDQKYWKVDGHEANVLTQLFVSRAGGTGDDRAWTLLTADLREEYGDLSAFSRYWDGDYWAETDGTTHRDDKNTFDVTIRHYERDNHVTERDATLRLTATDDGPKIDHYDPGDRANVVELAYVTVYTDHARGTWSQPRTSGRPALVPGRFIETGGRLIALCELMIDGSARPGLTTDDVGWWTRTHQGWIPNSMLAEGHDGRIAGLPDCDPSAAQR